MRQSVSDESHKRVVSEWLDINCDKIERYAADNILLNQFEELKSYECPHSKNLTEDKSRYVSMTMDIIR